MYEETAYKIKEFITRLDGLGKSLNLDGLRAQIEEMEARRATDGFWEDPERAMKLEQQLKAVKTRLSGPEVLRRELEDAQVLVELAEAEQDESMAAELKAQEEDMERKLRQLEINSLLSSPNDSKNAIVNVHPGAGGTESCDWADMLYRMVLRYCERQGFDIEVVDYQEGDEAGIKGAAITVKGPFAYGYLKGEAGVHRLVRISPFDAAKRRHTSFAAIEVLVEVDDSVNIEIREEDIKMDVFRSSGPGGQKVNKTSSAVRLTHLPTGIVVACQTERSQHRNKDTALNMIKSKLYDIEMKKQEAELAAQREGKKEVAWGSQIRSYVLHPYQLIKDHRTDVETGNIDRVLDGELDEFVEAYLKWKLEARSLN